MIKLPFNDNPYIKNLSHNAFVNGILSAEYINNTLLSRFETNIDKLDVMCENVEYDIIDNMYYIYEKNNVNNPMCIFYKEINLFAEKDFKCRIKLFEQKMYHSWSGFNIILSDCINFNYEKDEKNIIKIGHPVKKNGFLKINREFEKEFFCIESEKYPIVYDITITDEHLIVSISDSNKNTEKFIVNLFDYYKVVPLYLLISIEPGINQYYNWEMMNYINLIGYKDQFGNLLLDYYNSSRKNYKNYRTDYMIECAQGRLKLQKKKEMIKYIYDELKKGWYLVLKVDQYYIQNSDEYNNMHHEHEMILYGCDINNKKIYLAGYLKNGIFKTVEMSISTFYDSIKLLNDKTLYKLRSFPHEECYQFRIGLFKKKLREYLEGENSSLKYLDNMPFEEGVYGIEIYKYLLKNNGLIKRLNSDIRFAYTIYEHKYMMKRKIKYLIDNGIYKDKDALKKIDNILMLCVELKKGVMYKLMKNKISLTSSQVTDIIEKIMEQEIELYTEILEKI